MRYSETIRQYATLLIVCQFMNWSQCVTCSSCVTGVAAITFFSCRGSDRPADQTFTISSCPVGHVISIWSAEVGHDRLWDKTIPKKCSWETATCRRSVANNAAIMGCNGQRSCSFSGAIFVYPPSSVLPPCDPPKDGNYIDINYDCITGT